MKPINGAETTQDVVRVYDVTDGGMLRVERVHRQRGGSVSASTTTVGRVDLEAIVAFEWTPIDIDGETVPVPMIDMTECDDDMAAFGKELVA